LKKARLILIAVLLVLVAVFVSGFWWARTEPETARSLLLATGLDAARADTVLGWIGAGPKAGAAPRLTGSGTIVADEILIVSELGGRIVRLNADEGDEVQAGQVLVELDTSLIEARLAQAEAAVTVAQANLDAVRAGRPRAAIEAARAAAAKAASERDTAETAWHDAQAILEHPQQIDSQIVQTKAALAVAEARIEQAQAQVKEAEAKRDLYRAQGTMQEKWMYRIYDQQVVAAKAALEAAQAAKAGADSKLADLQTLRAKPLALVSQVHLAEQQYRLAAAAAVVADAQLAEAQAGPTAEELAVAEARLAQAQAAVAGIRRQNDRFRLRTPIDGVVSSRAAHTGETAAAGATLLSVMDLDEVRLTFYLPENRLGQVALGQPVQIRVDAYPTRTFSGTISYIAQQAEFTPKNVQTEEERINLVFAVHVRIPNPDHLLKPGMPADVTWE
jgi:multidrug resistance efflux pump